MRKEFCDRNISPAEYRVLFLHDIAYRQCGKFVKEIRREGMLGNILIVYNVIALI